MESQYMTALAKANKIRLARAELKRKVRAGEIAVADLLAPGATIPQEAESMTLCELLCAQQGWGIVRAKRAVLRPLGIGEICTVGSLTDRRRERVVEALRGRVRDERFLQVAA